MSRVIHAVLWWAAAASFFYSAALASPPSGVIDCNDPLGNNTNNANQVCSEFFGLGAVDQTIEWSLSEDLSEVTYVTQETTRSVCTRANLDFTGSFFLTGWNKTGYTRTEGGSCELCEGRSFCQWPVRLLDDCPCDNCSAGGSAFYGNWDKDDEPIRCGRCPFTCSNVGLQLMPTGGDSCFICNEELSIPNFQQSNCLTLEGWWIEQPVSLEDIAEFQKAGPTMPFSDRMKRCYPNPDAFGIDIKDSLGARGAEIELSHCKRSNLIYPVEDPNLIGVGEVYDDRCNDVATGALCLGCLEGFTKRGSFFGNCTACTGAEEVGVVFRVMFNVFVVIASVFFTLRMEKSFRMNKGEKMENMLQLTIWKILINHLQLLSALALLSIPWEEETLSFFTIGEYLALARIDFRCAYPMNFVRQELLFVVLFWFTMLACTIIAVFLRHVYHRRGFDLCALDQASLNIEMDLDVLSLRLGAAAIAAILAMHFLATNIALQAISCLSMDFDQNPLSASFLLKDPTKTCWEGSLGNWQYGLGIPLVILLIVVIPVCLFVGIKRGGYTFLTHFYKADLAYWDVIILMRKILFLLCVVLLTDYGEAVETTHAMVVIALSLALQCYFSPYVSPVANFTDGLGLVVLMFSISLGSFKASPRLNEPSKTACTVFFFIVNILYLLLFPALAFLERYQKKRLRQMEDGLTHFAERWLRVAAKPDKDGPENYVVQDEGDKLSQDPSPSIVIQHKKSSSEKLKQGGSWSGQIPAEQKDSNLSRKHTLDEMLLQNELSIDEYSQRLLDANASSGSGSETTAEDPNVRALKILKQKSMSEGTPQVLPVSGGLQDRDDVSQT